MIQIAQHQGNYTIDAIENPWKKLICIGNRWYDLFPLAVIFTCLKKIIFQVSITDSMISLDGYFCSVVKNEWRNGPIKRRKKGGRTIAWSDVSLVHCCYVIVQLPIHPTPPCVSACGLWNYREALPVQILTWQQNTTTGVLGISLCVFDSRN